MHGHKYRNTFQAKLCFDYKKKANSPHSYKYADADIDKLITSQIETYPELHSKEITCS